MWQPRGTGGALRVAAPVMRRTARVTPPRTPHAVARRLFLSRSRRASLSRRLRRLRTTMPKNKGKGGKNRRRGKNEGDEKRELVFKEDGQEYAQVLRMLGNGRLEAQCIDGVKRLCHIRGKMRKKVWVNNGDIILLGLRDFQDEKADVILKYLADEARSLKAYGELPDSIRVNETDTFEEERDENDDFFDFDDVENI